jgi:hypothetical protein
MIQILIGLLCHVFCLVRPFRAGSEGGSERTAANRRTKNAAKHEGEIYRGWGGRGGGGGRGEGGGGGGEEYGECGSKEWVEDILHQSGWYQDKSDGYGMVWRTFFKGLVSQDCHLH